MRNSLFRFITKFRETTSLFRETRNLFRFVFCEIRNETSFAGNPSRRSNCNLRVADRTPLKSGVGTPDINQKLICSPGPKEKRFLHLLNDAVKNRSF
jgi:hypothetical protein